MANILSNIYFRKEKIILMKWNEITVQVLYDNSIGLNVVDRFLKKRYWQHDHVLSQYFCKITGILVLFITLMNW